METVQIKVALRLLAHAGIPTCITGEIALNYYNVPRAVHVSTPIYYSMTACCRNLIPRILKYVCQNC